MKSLHVRNLFIWPRFEERVRETLGSRRPDVSHCHATMTPTMALIQKHIIRLMEACVNEIQSMTSIDVSEINVKEVSHLACHRIILVGAIQSP